MSLSRFTDSYPSSAEGAPPKVLPRPGRSVVIAKNGIVATSHPLAAQAGLDILKAGGNAADAAIAANAMIGLVEPMSCGIGGDLFVIYWDAKTKKLYGLNASGRSPYKLNRDVFAQKKLSEMPETGPLSWSVPGCVDGWEMLRSRFGTMNYDKLLASSIQTAEEGFPEIEINVWFAMYAPKGTPKPVIDKLSAALQEALKDPEVKSRLAANGAETVTSDRATPEALRRDRKSTRLNSSHVSESRMPSSA